jgi:hypothetical protein
MHFEGLLASCHKIVNIDMNKTLLLTVITLSATGFIVYVSLGDLPDDELLVSNNPASARPQTRRNKSGSPTQNRNLKALSIEKAVLENTGSSATNGKAGEKAGTVPAGKVAKRLAQIKDEVAGFVSSEDGKGLINLLKEMKNFGPAAYSQIAKIVSLLDRDKYKDKVFSDDYNKFELSKTLPPGIFAWALADENFEEVGATFRYRAYSALPYSDAANVEKLLVAAFIKEDSKWGLRRIKDTLKELPSEGISDSIISMLGTNPELNGDKKWHLENTLFSMPGQAVDNYIDDKIASTTDRRELDHLRYNKVKRNPVATGYLISSTSKNTQATRLGLKAGDTIVQYGDYKINKHRSIDSAKKKMRDAQSIQMVVIRDGEEMLFNFKPGQIGIDGGVVRKK